MGDEAQDTLLQYRTECSEVTPRAALVRLRWPASLKERDAVRIDVSIYKDGFATGRFVTATAAPSQEEPEIGITMMATEGPMAKAPIPQPLLLELQTLRVIEETGADDESLVEAVVGGLIPGLNYYVRIPGLDADVVRFRAPICPVDFVDTDGDQPR